MTFGETFYSTYEKNPDFFARFSEQMTFTGTEANVSQLNF